MSRPEHGIDALRAEDLRLIASSDLDRFGIARAAHALGRSPLARLERLGTLVVDGEASETRAHVAMDDWIANAPADALDRLLRDDVDPATPEGQTWLMEIWTACRDATAPWRRQEDDAPDPEARHLWSETDARLLRRAVAIIRPEALAPDPAQHDLFG